MNPDQKPPPYISLDQLLELAGTAGELEISIREIDGRFIPFIYFTPAAGVRTTKGIIVEDGNALATEDLPDLLLFFEQLIGSDHIVIFPPGHHPNPTMH